jgi:NAD-dependent aldehyde dehydrogenases
MIGENFIGNTKSAKGNTTFTTFNPQKNQNNPWQFTEATLAEVDAACTLATEAFVTYRKISDKTKALFLRAIVTEIEALGNTLLEVYCLESGLLRDRAVTERARTVKQLNNFATLLEAGNWVNVSINTVKPNKATKAKVDLRKMNIPIGPVVVFGASNFPLAYSTAGGDTASALAAGCPVIVKSHPMHAGTGALVAEAVLKAAVKIGMPNGVFSNLNSQQMRLAKLWF